MPNILKRYGYYSIFFAISGIIHYYLCFYNPLELEIKPKSIKIAPGAKYQFKVSVSNNLYEDFSGKVNWKATGGIINDNGEFIAGKTKGKFKVIANYQKLSAEADVYITKKIVKISAATLKAMAIKKKPKAEKKKTKKKVEKKKKEPKKIDKKKKKIYRENLEKKLREEFEKKFKELMKKQNEKLKKLKEQNEKKFDELKKKNQKDVEKLKKEKEEYKKNNQQLRKYLAKYDKAIKDLKKDQQKKLQQTQKDINELKEKHRQKLANTKKQYEDKIQKQKNNLSQLSNTLMLLKSKQAKQQNTIKNLKEQKKKQQRLSQKQLEQKILAQKKLREKAKKISKTQERAVIKKQWKSLEQVRSKSLQHHKQLVKKFSTNSDKGEAVPSLSFFDTYFKNNLSKIINFHKMKLVAYPETRDFFISINLDKSYGNGKYRKRTDFSYFGYFSNRAIAAERGFPSVVGEIRNNSKLYHPMNGHLSLAFIFPQSTADYLAWKSVTVCKKHGYNPKNVAICYGYFQQKNNGFWSFIITKLRLKNGQAIKVDDFETNW